MMFNIPGSFVRRFISIVFRRRECSDMSFDLRVVKLYEYHISNWSRHKDKKTHFIFSLIVSIAFRWPVEHAL